MSDIVPAKKKEVQAFIIKHETALLSTLPQGIDRDRFTALALQAVLKVPALYGADKISLFGALCTSVSLGLEPNGALGEAYILPYNNKKTGRIEAKFMLGYRGMVKLVHQSNRVHFIEPVVVDELDEFQVTRGLHADIVHVPSETPSGNFRAVYAIAHMVDGPPKFEVLFWADIEHIRASSQTSKFGPWVDHFNEMVKKSAVRRLFKMLPNASDNNNIERAIKLDEEADAGVQQSFDVEIIDDVEIETVDNNEKMKELMG